VEEGIEHFGKFPKITRILTTLHDVGLDYIKLGQSAPTLSGGESQRIKLAKELSKRSTGKTLYMLDEPTTFLHFEDIRKLLTVLDRLVDSGNTVLVIEHNLDVIKTADWVIDIGPEGGRGGGRLVAAGTPEDVAAVKESHTGSFLKGMLGVKKAGGNRQKAAGKKESAVGSKQSAAGKKAPVSRAKTTGTRTKKAGG
ncbi:ATP-binding cassette domain-containing protein, partial [bacterium]|nr:ATP-binding cassette domain-containing protein [bacterium]